MNYQTIFTGERARTYDLAMRNYPFVRKAEFDNLFRHFPLSMNEIILDIPSGGEYLQKLYPSNTINSVEFSDSFNCNNILKIDEDWNLCQYDRIVCLAALHHVEDLETFIRKLSLCAYESAIIHLADVSKDSKESIFLDEFVDEYNPQGHKGYYRKWEDVLWPKGLNVLSIDTIKCPWKFSTISDMISFCKNLFGITKCPDDVLLSSLKEYIGYSDNEYDIFLDWELTYVDLIKC